MSRLLRLLLLLSLTACGAPGTGSGTPLVSTYSGLPADYRGDGLLLVITWAEWASVWPLLREELEEYRSTAPAGVDFLFVNADEHPDIVRQTGADIIPSIVVVKGGRTLEMLPNVTTADELHQVVEKWSAG